MPLSQRRLPSPECRRAENKNTEFCPVGRKHQHLQRHEETHRTFQHPKMSTRGRCQSAASQKPTKGTSLLPWTTTTHTALEGRRKRRADTAHSSAAAVAAPQPPPTSPPVYLCYPSCYKLCHLNLRRANPHGTVTRTAQAWAPCPS